MVTMSKFLVLQFKSLISKILYNHSNSRCHTFSHFRRRWTTLLRAFLDEKERSCEAIGSVAAALRSSGLFSFSAAISSICPIFHALKNHMHTAAARYIIAVKI